MYHYWGPKAKHSRHGEKHKREPGGFILPALDKSRQEKFFAEIFSSIFRAIFGKN